MVTFYFVDIMVIEGNRGKRLVHSAKKVESEVYPIFTQPEVIKARQIKLVFAITSFAAYRF